MARFVRTYWSALLLGIVGLILAISGILSATVFRPAEFITASLPSEGQSVIVTSKSNALNILADKVSIKASSKSDTNVTIVVGRASDVDGWANGRPHTEISGLASWTKLAYTTVKADPKAKPLSEQDLVSGSDMWLAQKTAKGSVELDWSQREYPTSFAVFADGKSNVNVTLHWQRPVQTPLLLPLLIIGLVLIAAAAVVFYILFRLQQHAPAESKPVETPQLSPSELVGEPGARRPSRRALRQARQAGEEKLVVDGKEFPTGMIPKITIPEPVAEDENVAEAETDSSAAPVEPAPVESAVTPEPAAATPAETDVESVETVGEDKPQDNAEDNSAQAPVEAPVEVPVDAPVETPAEAPIESPVEAAVEPAPEATPEPVSEPVEETEEHPEQVHNSGHYLFQNLEMEPEGEMLEGGETQASEAEGTQTPEPAEGEQAKAQESEEDSDYEDLAAKWMNTVRKWND